MNILMISDVRPDSVGGMQSFLRDLNYGLEYCGDQVHTWAAVDHLVGQQECDDSWKKELKDFKPDIIHVHNFSYLLEQRWPLFHTGVPTVASLADYMVICPLRMRLHNWRRCPTPCRFDCCSPDWLKAMRKALGSTSLITFCQGAADIFTAHGLDVGVIPLGLHLEEWPFQSRGTFLAGASCAHDRYWWKGLHVAREVCDELGIALQEAKGLDRQRLASWYQSLQVFISPSVFDETFGLMMAEAMASGAVVLAYRNAGAASLIRDGVTGYLIDLGDQTGLRENLRQVLAHDNSWIQENARREIEQQYNLPLMVQRWRKLYHDLQQGLPGP